MPLVEVKTEIHSDLYTCFDLARNIDIHKESLKHTREIAIAGKTAGYIGLGEWVSWEAIHFGVAQHLTSKITEFNRPYFFVDEMVLGAFKSYRHEHIFEQKADKTLMLNKFYFESPYGVIGKLANLLVLKKYMTKLLAIRGEVLKQHAEKITANKLITNFKLTNKTEFHKL